MCNYWCRHLHNFTTWYTGVQHDGTHSCLCRQLHSHNVEAANMPGLRHPDLSSMTFCLVLALRSQPHSPWLGICYQTKSAVNRASLACWNKAWRVSSSDLKSWGLGKHKPSSLFTVCVPQLLLYICILRRSRRRIWSYSSVRIVESCMMVMEVSVTTGKAAHAFHTIPIPDIAETTLHTSLGLQAALFTRPRLHTLSLFCP